MCLGIIIYLNILGGFYFIFNVYFFELCFDIVGKYYFFVINFLERICWVKGGSFYLVWVVGGWILIIEVW